MLNALFIYFSLCKFTNSSCYFWNTSQFSFKFCINLQCHETTPLSFFSSNIIYFDQRIRLKSTSFRFSKCYSQNSLNFCQFWNYKSIPLQILHHSSLSWHIIPLSILSSNIFYFGQKDPIKVQILTLSSDLVKICLFPHLIFQTTCQFFFKFCISLQCHER